MNCSYLDLRLNPLPPVPCLFQMGSFFPPLNVIPLYAAPGLCADHMPLDVENGIHVECDSLWRGDPEVPIGTCSADHSGVGGEHESE